MYVSPSCWVLRFIVLFLPCFFLVSTQLVVSVGMKKGGHINEELVCLSSPSFCRFFPLPFPTPKINVEVIYAQNSTNLIIIVTFFLYSIVTFFYKPQRTDALIIFIYILPPPHLFLYILLEHGFLIIYLVSFF